MNVALRHERLGTVSLMAATLADRILMDRLASDMLPVAKVEALWLASLLLEENEYPVPGIVTDVLAHFRSPEAANDAEMIVESPFIDEADLPPAMGSLVHPLRAVVTS